MNPAFDISIIIPAKDEEKRLPRFLQTIADHCRKSPLTYEVIVVDDGSSDGTAQAAESFRPALTHLTVLRLAHNRGKGFAVKSGFFAARGEIVLFLDADGSTPVEEIERNLHYLKESFDIIIGSRVIQNQDCRVNALAYRRWIGIIFNFLVHNLLIKNIKDTQCGFKMFRRSIIRPLFGRVYLNGFGFDLETLFIAEKMGYKIKEVAVNWTHVDGSKINLFKDSLRMFFNIIQIKNWHYTPINTSAQHMSVEELANMYQQEKKHWWFMAKEDFIQRIISSLAISPRRTLDAGCGTGHNLEFLRNKTSYAGMDVAHEALQFCRHNGIERLAQGNLEDVGFKDKSFDLILALDVIEHCEDPERAVSQFKRLLSDDGYLLVTAPAFRFLWSPHDESLSHMRRYNKKDLEILLSGEGFEIKKIGFLYCSTFLPVAAIRMVRKIFIKTKDPRSDTFTTPAPLINRIMHAILRLESRLIPSIPLPFGTSLYAVAVKRDK